MVRTNETLCALWYHLQFKKRESTHGGVLHLNFILGTKSHKVIHINPRLM